MAKYKEVQTVEIEKSMIFSHCEGCKLSSRTVDNKCGACGRKRIDLGVAKKVFTKAT